MGSFTFKKAVKYDAKLRLALCGPAGSGKTYTALTIGTYLGGPIAYVDTEHGSASKYANEFDFDVIEPDTFDPRDLIEMIRSAVENNYRVICIDSLSHYWMGTGGELEMVDAAAKKIQGNSFAAWKTVTPIHNKLVDTLISASIHIIVGIRTRTEWVVEKDERTGKSTPRKIGLAPIMRDGIEFEFDVCGDMDQDNNFTVTKSRCPQLTGKVINRPGKDVAETLRIWLASPHPAPTSTPAPLGAAAQANSAGGSVNGHAPASQTSAGNGSNTKPKGETNTPTQSEQTEHGKEEGGRGIPPSSEIPPALAKLLEKFTTADRYGRLHCFSDLKKDIDELTGSDMPYYEILGKHIPETRWRDGQPHADCFKTLREAKSALVELWDYCSRVTNAAFQEPETERPEHPGQNQPPVATMSADEFVQGLEPRQEGAHVAGN